MVPREIPELKKTSFTGMEKYRARKLLRGLLSFPVPIQKHCVSATVLDPNLKFLKEPELCPWKGRGLGGILCVVGMEEGVEGGCWKER